MGWSLNLEALAASHTYSEDGDYVVVSAKLARDTQSDVKCLDKDSALLAEVLDTTMFAQSEIDTLEEYLVAATGVDRRAVATTSRGDYQPFQAVHLVVSNRYSEVGDDGASTQAADTADELAGNGHQRLPRPHLDLRRDLQGHRDISAVLQKVFRLIAERVKEHHPDSYKALMEYVEALPLGSWSPCYPFAGFVLNFGPMTKPHRDQDLKMCVVVTFGRFSGGDLALYEGKLLLKLDNFSICFFPSDVFTHFNLPFDGQRISMALSTEKVSKFWVHDRNFWRTLMYTKTKGGKSKTRASRR